MGNQPYGAKNVNSATVNIGTSSETLAVARPTRRSLTIVNRDTTNFVTINGGGVAATTVMFSLLAGESKTITHTGLITAIADTAACDVEIWDEFD